MSYDLILCGTGFASSFFLLRFRKRFPSARVIVLERGPWIDYFDAVAARRSPGLVTDGIFKQSGMEGKQWLFTLGMGGSSNCWWGQTPRMWPEDFELNSRFGVGYDWPLSYDDLAPYYDQAEAVMKVSGSAAAPYPRSGPCPQVPHPISSLDARLQAHVGADLWAASPTARSSEGTQLRSKCCAKGICGLCPVDAKFRIMNELGALYTDDPLTEVITGATVREVILEGGAARGVRYARGAGEIEVRAELVFLGLNALFNPTVLIASGDKHPLTGKRLFEQASRKMTVDFFSLKDFDGGTHITGLGYMYYGGEQRSSRASCLIEHYNAPPILRKENGKWRARGVFKIIAENIPENRNEVRLVGGRTHAHFAGHTDYALRALDEVQSEFTALLSDIDGIEAIETDDLSPSEGHIQGTTVMAHNASGGVLNHGLRHHTISNLLVGGAGAFPSGPGSNPSLTIAALSLRAADLL